MSLKVVLLAVVFLAACNLNPDKGNYDASKKNLLVCSKDWSSRTDNEKVIGCWTTHSETFVTKGRGLNVHIGYQLIFYSDSSMDDVTFFGKGGTSKPIKYHSELFNIDNGNITYYKNSTIKTESISVDENQIIFNGREYYKTSCD